MKHHLEIVKGLADESLIKAICSIQKKDGYHRFLYLSSKRLLKLISKGEIFFLYYLDSDLVGFASLYFDSFRARIHFLSVKKKFQGQGIGGFLLSSLIKEANKKGAKLIYIIIDEHADKVKNFLLKRNFIKAGVHKHRQGEGKHSLILNLVDKF